MDSKEELRLMVEEVQCAGIFTRFQTSRFWSFWQARVMSVVGEQDEVITLGTGVGPTEESARAGSLEELRLKMSIGGRA